MVRLVVLLSLLPKILEGSWGERSFIYALLQAESFIIAEEGTTEVL